MWLKRFIRDVGVVTIVDGLVKIFVTIREQSPRLRSLDRTSTQGLYSVSTIVFDN